MNLPALLFQVKRISEDPPCKCPSKFCVERLSQGRYRVGEKILFIRVNFHFSLDSLFSWACTELELGVTGKIWPVTKQELPKWCFQLGLKTWGMEIFIIIHNYCWGLNKYNFIFLHIHQTDHRIKLNEEKKRKQILFLV